VDSLLKASNYQQPPVKSDVRVLPHGALPVGDWKDAAILFGLGWSVTIGAFSTGIVGGGAGTVLDADQPEGIISVPSGWVMRPIRVHVQCETPLIAADDDESEILLGVDPDTAYDDSGTVTTETPINLLTGHKGGGCPLTCVSAATANITAPTLGLELARKIKVADVQGTAANALWGELDLLYEPVNPPFIQGPAAMYLYVGGTVATNFYAQIAFIAARKEAFEGLAA